MTFFIIFMDLTILWMTNSIKNLNDHKIDEKNSNKIERKILHFLLLE